MMPAMTESHHRELLMSDILAGETLAVANRVLRWHGIAEVGPCSVVDLFNHLAPMEMGRFAHIVREVTEAIAGDEEEEWG